MVGIYERLELLDLDEYVGRVTAKAARSLVDHDPPVGQRVAFARRAGSQEDRRHRGGHADAHGAHRRPEVLHRVVHSKASCHHSTGRVDVQTYVPLGVLCLEEEQLGDDEVSHVIFDRVAQEDDALLEQPAVDVVSALASTRRLDDHGNEHGGRRAGGLEGR